MSIVGELSPSPGSWRRHLPLWEVLRSVEKRLGKRNRLDFWSAAPPKEPNMVTLQPNRKLPPRPNLFQILISAFCHPAGSLIKGTVHINVQVNKTQWNLNNSHSFSSFPWQARARAVRSVGDVPWRQRALCMAEQLGKDGRRKSPELRALWSHCNTESSMYIKLDVSLQKRSPFLIPFIKPRQVGFERPSLITGAF